MPNFLVRRPLLAKSNIKVGTNGVAASQIIWGSACITAPSTVGDNTASGSVAVSNVSGGETLVLTANTGLPTTVTLYAASAVSGGVAASFINSGSADQSASAEVTVSYLIFS